MVGKFKASVDLTFKMFRLQTNRIQSNLTNILPFAFILSIGDSAYHL